MRDIESKIVNGNQLSEVVAGLKRAGRRIITTNGCFDILHWGHIKYLGEARSLGDILIVGLNSDSSVKRIKGPTRPICDEQTRLHQMAGLEAVDYVSLFSETTPETWLARVQPYVHVKGGDYRPESLPERGVVEAGGGKIVCLPLVPGLSTTKLLQKLQES